MNKLLVPIIAILAICQTNVEAQVPKLVVLLSGEELRTDLLEEMIPYLPDDGIKRLMTDGMVYTNIYNPLQKCDATAATAILQTGTTANQNGITERFPIIRDGDGKIQQSHKSVFSDDHFMGFATSQRLSPNALTAPTIADKLKQATGRQGLVISIAPNPEEAIIGGGRQADGVYWLDDYTAKWVSSTFYKTGYPWYINKYNTNKGVANTLNQQVWRPINESEFESKYNFIPYISKESNSPFKYTFAKDGTSITKYKQSALVNEEIVQLAGEVLEYSNIGRDNMPDLLNLHFYMGNRHDATSDITPELIDNYYRADRAIARLLADIDKYVGIQHTIFAVVGTSMAKEYYTENEVIGTFFAERCKALLNMYLMAQYGQKNWVDEVTENQVFLNKHSIESSKIHLNEVQDQAAHFLSEFSGVATAVSNHLLKENALLAAEDQKVLTLISVATNKNRGDVIFELLPGWVSQTQGSHSSFTMSRVPSPLIITHPTLKGKRIEAPTDLRRVSAIISQIIRIRPPTP